MTLWQWVSTAQHFKWNLGRILLGLPDPWQWTHYIPSTQGKPTPQCHNPVYPNHQNDCKSLRSSKCHNIHKNSLLSLSWASQIHPTCLPSIYYTLFPSALYPPFCMYLSPPQVFHAQPTLSSLNQSMETTKHEDPYHMSQFKSFSPLLNLHQCTSRSLTLLTTGLCHSTGI